MTTSSSNSSHQMSSNDTLRDLRIRRWIDHKQCWSHTSVGRETFEFPSFAEDVGETDYESASTDTTSDSSESQPPSPSSATNPIHSPRAKPAPHPPSAFQLITWNIDFMVPEGYERTAAALDHIQGDVCKCKDGDEPPPCVILLQEIHQASLPAILEHPWVRAHFLVAPVKTSAWPGGRGYGNVTLVARTVPVVSAQMLAFSNSAMGRHALLVDLRMRTVAGGGARSRSREVTVRVANVHLESLPVGTAARPVQLAATAEMLRAEGVYAGLVCGDMNPIQEQDRNIHIEARLLDAWTEGDDAKDGFTWGYQPPSRYAPKRMDKILYTSHDRCKVDKPRQIGAGLKLESGRWLSDHYGLVTRVHVLG